MESLAEIRRIGEMDITQRLQYWEEKTRDKRRLEKMRDNYTSIPGVSDQLRLPRVGKIHLGIKKVNNKGVEYPAQTDYFVVSASDTTPEWAVNAFHEVYGEQPKELDIMFPLNDRESCFPQAYKRYSKAGLECKGNGITAVQTVEGKLVEIDCNPETCEHFQKNNCHLRGHLQVMLPNVPGMGVWQIDTGSFNSVRNINSGLAFVASLTNGRIAMIPLKLVIRPHKGRDPKSGAPTNNYVLDLANEKIKMADVLMASTQPPAKVLMPWIDFDAEDAEVINNWAEPPEEEVAAETVIPSRDEPVIPQDSGLFPGETANTPAGTFCINCGQKITNARKTVCDRSQKPYTCVDCERTGN